MGQAAGQQDGQPQQAAAYEHQADPAEAQQDRQEAKVQARVLQKKGSGEKDEA